MARQKKEDDKTYHDDIVAFWLQRIPLLESMVSEQGGGWPQPSAEWRPVTVETEKKVGRSYIDIFVGRSLGFDCHICKELRRPRELFLGVVVEVKTQREQWTAGDVLRQFKQYEAALVCEHMRSSNGRCAVFVFISERELTENERALFEHENVVVVTPQSMRAWLDKNEASAEGVVA